MARRYGRSSKRSRAAKKGWRTRRRRGHVASYRRRGRKGRKGRRRSVRGRRRDRRGRFVRR